MGEEKKNAEELKTKKKEPKANEAKKPNEEKKEEFQPDDSSSSSSSSCPKIITVILGVHMHCEACPQEIKRCILKMKGVESAEPDLNKSEVRVKGVFDPAKLVNFVLKETGKQAVIVKKEVAEKKQKAEEKKAEEGEKEKKKEGKGEEEKEKKERVQRKSHGKKPKIITVILGVHMHCEACPQEIKRCILKMKGVESAKPDLNKSEVRVKGVFDPAKLVNFVLKETGKQAVIVKKEAAEKKQKAEEKKAEEGEKEKKKEGKGEEEKEKKERVQRKSHGKKPKIITVILGVHMHCEACPQEIKRCILKMKGVESAEPDLNKSEVRVKGVFDPAKLVNFVLKETGKQAVIVKKEVAEKKQKAEEKKAEEGEKEKKKEGKGEENEEKKERVLRNSRK